MVSVPSLDLKTAKQGCRNDFELTGSNQHKCRQLSGSLSGSLELSEKSSGSLEPLEPPLTTALLSMQWLEKGHKPHIANFY